MTSIEDLKLGYLDLIRTELSDYGVDISKIFLTDSYGLKIESHTIDLNLFKEKTGWSASFPLRVYVLDDDKTIIFNSLREDSNQYREDDFLQEEMENHINKVNNQISELSSYFFEQVAEINDNLSLEERILDSLKHNIQITNSLSDIKDWKAKIILGNSIGGSKEERLKIGDFDSVGYTWIGLTTGLIIPVARGDEHHRGGDLIYYLIANKMIPEDSYYPIFFNHDYVNKNNSKAIQAFKIWRKLGGPNILLNSFNSDTPFQVTMDDYIKANGNIEVRKGELLPIGKKFIDMMNIVSKLCIEASNDERKEKRLYIESLKTYNFYLNNVLKYPRDEDKLVLKDIMKAESIGGVDGIKEIEKIFFGFNGFKNKLHNQVRKALKSTYSFEREIAGVFGDLDLANHLLGSF